MTNPVSYNGHRAKTIMIVMGILLAVQAAMMVSNYAQMGLLLDFREGNIDVSLAEQHELRHGLISLASLAASVCSMVFFIRWFRRAYHNLEKAGQSTEFAEGWAAGSWFVPFLNLVRPFQIMREVWYKTQEAVSGEDGLRSGRILGWWWAAYLGGNFFTSAGSIMAMQEESIDSLLSATQWQLYGGLVEWVAGGLAILIIRDVSSFEDKLYTQLENQAAEENGHLLGFVKI